MKRKNNKGLTLVELLVVLVILITITVLAVSKINNVVRESNEKATLANAKTFMKKVREGIDTSRLTSNFTDGIYYLDDIYDMDVSISGTKPTDGIVIIDDGKIFSACLKYEKFTYKYVNNKEDVIKSGSCDDIINIEYAFDYTGTEEIFTAPYNGYYKIEAWGAQGGNSHDPNVFGGYGGYSVGDIDLKQNDKLYINVGEQGQNVTSDILSTSYNGGASCRTNAASRSCGNGGGATSVAFTSGLLKTLSVPDLVIVSGGGGGASTHDSDTTTSGGSGGGYIGSSGSSTRWGFGTGGTQSEGGARATTDANAQNGSFGLGGNGALNAGAGGGGGFYGGGGGHGGSGGGGSSYIGNSKLSNKVMYCYNCATSNEVATKTISVTNASETPISNHAKLGNGYVKITYTGSSY